MNFGNRIGGAIGQFDAVGHPIYTRFNLLCCSLSIGLDFTDHLGDFLG